MPQESWEICDFTTSYIQMDSSISSARGFGRATATDSLFNPLVCEAVHSLLYATGGAKRTAQRSPTLLLRENFGMIWYDKELECSFWSKTAQTDVFFSWLFFADSIKTL
ncbi:unnamed protein product [Boreogadus saida]